MSTAGSLGQFLSSGNSKDIVRSAFSFFINKELAGIARVSHAFNIITAFQAGTSSTG